MYLSKFISKKASKLFDIIEGPTGLTYIKPSASMQKTVEVWPSVEQIMG